MAVPVWPAALPQRLEQQGYQEGIGDGRLRSNMDAGPAKVRQRFRPTRPLSGSITMTIDGLETFRSFVTNDLAGGTLPFQFPARGGPSMWLVRFADEMPTWSPRGGKLWHVSLALEILP